MSEEAEVWGNLKEFESYGRHGDTNNDYEMINFEDSKKNYTGYKHAAHGMLFCRTDDILWELYDSKAAVLMQMRFDGLIGFPGGLVDEGEEPVVAVNREFQEEICLNLDICSFTDDNHVITYLNKKKNLVLHFFSKEVTVNEFEEIDRNSKNAYDYGKETLGNIRPPLFTMGDNFRGLPAFLCNQFAGTARQQLLFALTKAKILTHEEAEKAVKAADDFLESRR